MKAIRLSLVLTLLLGLLAVAAATAQEGEVSSYVVLTNRNVGLPGNVVADLEASGAVVTRTFEQIGAVSVMSSNPAALGRIANVEGVVDNVWRASNGPELAEPVAVTAEDLAAANFSGISADAMASGVATPNTNPPFSGEDDFFFDIRTVFTTDAGEGGGDAVVIVLRPAFKWVVVTFRTLDANAEKELCGGFGGIERVSTGSPVICGGIDVCAAACR